MIFLQRLSFERIHLGDATPRKKLNFIDLYLIISFILPQLPTCFTLIVFIFCLYSSSIRQPWFLKDTCFIPSTRCLGVCFLCLYDLLFWQVIIAPPLPITERFSILGLLSAALCPYGSQLF